MRVTIERWAVFQAWDGQTMLKWAICHNGSPLMTFEDHASALTFAQQFNGVVEDQGHAVMVPGDGHE